MKVIVGLGNPGKKYEQTRHNIGFMVIDQLAQELNVSVAQSKHKGLVAEASVHGEKILLLKPMTYMNLSGESIKSLLDFYKIPIEDVFIIYDDLDSPFGKIKLRFKGSAGGHNGLKSIITHLQSQEFKRMKMGIDRPENGDIIAHVLGRFTKEEQQELHAWVQRAVQACLNFVEEEDFSKVMNRYNG